MSVEAEKQATRSNRIESLVEIRQTLARHAVTTQGDVERIGR
ncbi:MULTISPECIES: hypothetical protein [Parafrankia]|nr:MULTISPECIES: hypothetical protein [Parafrankia]